ncbi:MAG TPA: tripartite tricarboxylate transporter substrate binding protein [Burkholderiaceae bacterium]|jgi:tripartite-type tricarboxylate transporter receptor subunit TctC
MNISSRRTLLASLSLALAAGVGPALAQDAGYPAKTIRLVIPTAAGGGMDAMTRMIAEKLSDAWKQAVIVDNRAGGNGAIAYAAVANAAPDGYVVGLTLSSLVQTPLLYKAASAFSPKALTPFVVVAMLPNGFAVGKDVPVNSVAQFIEWARKQPNGVDYGSSGAGSSGNIMGGTLASAAGIQMLHVPFKGEAPATQALIGGQIKAVMAAPGSLVAQGKGGALKVLAVALPSRLKEYPDIPTFAEAGYPNVNLSGWSMGILPLGTPKPIADKLAAEITRIVRLPDVAARISALGFQSEGSTPEAARQFYDTELQRWDAAIKTSKVTIE